MGDSEQPTLGGGTCFVATSLTGAMFASGVVSNSSVTVTNLVFNNCIITSESVLSTGQGGGGTNVYCPSVFRCGCICYSAITLPCYMSVHIERAPLHTDVSTSACITANLRIQGTRFDVELA